jgi:CSLREA domain-containing protein
MRRRGSLVRGVVILALLAGASLLGPLPLASLVYAAAFTVTITQDAPNVSPTGTTCVSTLPSGPCTLRAAIQAHNALGGTNTINLSIAGTYALTVTGAGEDNAATGDLDVNGGSLTITNTSGGTVAIDGNATDRVFDVGPLAAAQVSISGVTIQNGDAVTPGGGSRAGVGSTLTLTNVTVANNHALDTGTQAQAQGGGVYNAGTLTLSSVTVSGNAAHNKNQQGQVPEGGGIFNVGTLTLTDVNISSNTTGVVITDFPPPGASTRSGRGAGLYNTGLATLTNATIKGNHTSEAGPDAIACGNPSCRPSPGGAGGGIYNTATGTVEVTNSAVADNVALDMGPQTQAQGGGIYNAGTVSLRTATVSGNAATNQPGDGQGTGQIPGGGGIFNTGILAMTDVSLSSNNTGGGFQTGRGAGLHNAGGATASLTNVTVNGNSTAEVDCLICNDGSASPPGGAGGGIYSQSTLTLSNVTLSGNTAGGVRRLQGNGLPPLLFPGQGGGLFGGGTLLNVTFNANTARPAGTATGQGGNVFGGPTLRNSIVANAVSGGNCSGSGITSGGSNLSSDNTCSFNATGDLNNTDPLLGPLANNGGFTQTHALQVGSPAINAVVNSCPPPSTDQRGVTRPQGTGCDSGAYEFQSTLVGDINADGMVDIKDYGVWRQNFGQTNCGNIADLNGDCLVDIRDYGIWRQHFGETAAGARAGGTPPTATPIPGRPAVGR